jgi:hypothetical protein
VRIKRGSGGQNQNTAREGLGSSPVVEHLPQVRAQVLQKKREFSTCSLQQFIIYFIKNRKRMEV